MNDMPSDIGCPSCGSYGYLCGCDRSRLIEERADKQRRESPGPTCSVWPYLPADAVARLGQTRPAEFIRMVPPGWEQEVAESARRWRQGNRASFPDRMKATAWRFDRGGALREHVEAGKRARKAGW